MKPVASVLLPIYNGEAYLKPAIESVLSQTSGDWELFIGDNASTDKTREIIESYRDPRIRIHRHTTNIGMAPNWDFLLQNAHGDYACILGADDLFYPTHLEQKISLLRNCPDAAFVHGPTDIIDAEGKVLRWNTPPEGARDDRDNLLKSFLKGNLLNIISIVFSLKIIRERKLHFESRFELMPDWHLWMLLLLLSERVCYDKQVTTAYRVHDDSITSRRIGSFAWDSQVFELLLELLRDFQSEWRQLGIDPAVEQAQLTSPLWAMAFQRLRKGNWNEAQHYWKIYRQYHGVFEMLRNVPSHYWKRLLAK